MNAEQMNEIIKTPEDAMQLLNERKAQHQELVDAAHAAYAAYYADLDRRGDRLAEQVMQLDQQRESVAAAQGAAQQALVTATVDGDADAMRREQDRIGQLNAQLSALDAQITALNEYVLRGDADLFHAAEAAIAQASADSEALSEYVSAVKDEVKQRMNAWSEVLHSYIGTGELPDLHTLRNHAALSSETVAERTARLDLEAKKHEEWRHAREAWEESQRKEEEERARRNKEPKPNPVRYAQVNGKIIKQVWNGSTGQYDDVGPVARRSVFS